MKAGVKITGTAELARAFARLPDAIIQKRMAPAIRKAMRKGVSVSRSKIQSDGSIRTGLLKKSITAKVKYYKRSKLLYAILGPDTAVSGTYKGKRVVPAKYSHLVEFGTTRSTPRPFIAPGMDAVSPHVVPELTRAFNQAVTEVAAT